MSTARITNTAGIGAVAIALMGGVYGAGAQAQDLRGYVTDTRGVVVKDPYGLCWRTSLWTPALAIADCDPDLLPKPAAAKPAPPATRAIAPAAPVAAAAPAVVAPKPAPVKPAPAAAPPKPAPAAAPVPNLCDAAMTLRSDELFAFGKAVLGKAAKARLDKDVIGRTAACAKLDSVVVEGHTDRIGSAKGNQTLSEKRANAVKAYLVSKGIPANTVQAVGKGASLPTTNCPDVKSRTKLIACLAADRRVMVAIKGPGKSPVKGPGK